ncbi:MAG: NADH-quinone oxidoreductase subunit J [Pseudomonadales bacterium]|nr:NADH-quinone oxidoreductase subunit J [Pseudomonadales bacterium]MDP6472694.1 NADH-quinone oxidoreductase subunit J [Pseudomonadales bacterium]MDP6827905.1 NADH-quinone oxidoreductase subunit J [Pseudomonadales bacterium]MDP6973511.1 NADH-quinone oxidoreductase subunit J [Pseudomonadales bacterium]
MEIVVFYIAAAVSVSATTLVVTRTNASHALVYLIVSLLAVAVIFFLLGAPFASALEIVIYAGAIMVLFLFVVMMLDLGRGSVEQERGWLNPSMWVGPGLLTLVLFLEMAWLLAGPMAQTSGTAVLPKEVGIELFGPYLLAVELASILLLASLVGAFHLGRRYMRARREEEADE